MATYSKSDIPAILEKLRKKLGEEVVAKDLYNELLNMKVTPGWILCPERRVGRGMYSLVDDVSNITPTAEVRKPAKVAGKRVKKPIPVGLEAMVAKGSEETESKPEADNVVQLFSRGARMQLDNLVPEVSDTYVPFGAFEDIKLIIESRIFYPVFITGLSGNGKSEMVEQCCARLARNYVRVNVTEETDEDDLIGGNTLVDGNVVFREGPVLTAMRTGSILLLDEVDLNATKILCLQSIMEGKPYFNKKTGETIHAAPGFNVFATANTKGRGSETGRFVGTKMMNEAFLERFPITIEQDYPSMAVEKKILNLNFTKLGVTEEESEDFVAQLTKWSDAIRKAYKEESTSEVITTRRLVSIARAFAIFRDRRKAVQLCLARFDEETKEAFLSLYEKIDVKAVASPATVSLT